MNDPILLLSFACACILLSFLVAEYGRHRKIGYWSTFLIGLFFSPMIALIVMLMSPKLSDATYEPTPNFSAADELKKYKELLDSGALTQQEYDIQKKKLLL